MGQRLDFQDVLQAIIGVRSDKKPNVYFQPPSNINMNYPCIIYSRSRIEKKAADNRTYGHIVGYTVMYVDINPDSLIPGKLLELPMSSFDQHYVADNLNHDVFTIYY